MLLARYAFLLALWLSIFNLYYTESREVSSGDMTQPSDCANCTICQYPCHHHTPSAPPGGYPLYGVPPPPQQQGYPSYGPPQPPAVGNCPQTSGGQSQCCYPPPASPYTYVPYGNYAAAASRLQNCFYLCPGAWAFVYYSILNLLVFVLLYYAV